MKLLAVKRTSARPALLLMCCAALALLTGCNGCCDGKSKQGNDHPEITRFYLA